MRDKVGQSCHWESVPCSSGSILTVLSAHFRNAAELVRVLLVLQCTSDQPHTLNRTEYIRRPATAPLSPPHLSHLGEVDEALLQVSGQALHHSRHLAQEDPQVRHRGGRGLLDGAAQLLEASICAAQVDQLLELELQL